MAEKPATTESTTDAAEAVKEVRKPVNARVPESTYAKLVDRRFQDRDDKLSDTVAKAIEFYVANAPKSE